MSKLLWQTVDGLYRLALFHLLFWCFPFMQSAVSENIDMGYVAGWHKVNQPNHL